MATRTLALLIGFFAAVTFAGAAGAVDQEGYGTEDAGTYDSQEEFGVSPGFDEGGEVVEENEEFGVAPEFGEEEGVIEEGSGLDESGTRDDETFGVSPEFEEESGILDGGEGMIEDENVLEGGDIERERGID